MKREATRNANYDVADRGSQTPANLTRLAPSNHPPVATLPHPRAKTDAHPNSTRSALDTVVKRYWVLPSFISLSVSLAYIFPLSLLDTFSVLE